MAKRLTDSRKYTDPWFRKLDPKYKLFWDYLLCVCDHAGIYKVDIEIASFLIGHEYCEESILSEIGARIHIVNMEKWFIPKFFMFQYGENNGSKACLSALKLLEKENLIKLLPNCYQTVKNKNKNMVKVKNKDKNKKIPEVTQIHDEKPDRKSQRYKGTGKAVEELILKKGIGNIPPEAK